MYFSFGNSHDNTCEVMFHCDFDCISPMITDVEHLFIYLRFLSFWRNACVCVCYSLSHVLFFVTPRTVARQTPQSMGFSRQEDWNGLPCPSPLDFPDPGIDPRSPALQADSLLFEPQGKSLIIKFIPKK